MNLHKHSPISIVCLMACACAIACLSFHFPNELAAQSTATSTDPADTPSAKSFASQFSVSKETQEKFDDSFERWRKIVVEIQSAGARFFNAKTAVEGEEYQIEYERLVKLGQNELELFIPIALELFANRKLRGERFRAWRVGRVG